MTGTALTMEMLRDTMRQMEALRPPPGLPNGRIIYSIHAMKDSTERLFPESRHRSARVRKKLVKRHGGEFRKVPTMWKLPDGTLLAHPVFKTAFRQHFPVMS